MAKATQPTSPDLEQKRARWRAPLVAAICAAALAGFVNLAGAQINGNAQHELETRTADSQHQLVVQQPQRLKVAADLPVDASRERGQGLVQSAAPCSPPPNARADLDRKWLDDNCRYKFPPNDGFEGLITEETLPPGAKIDRYGQPGGRYFAPAGTPYEARAIPYDVSKMDYYQYEVVKGFVVAAGRTAAWFDQPGGGTQYRTTMSAQQLVAEGYLKETKP